MENYKAGKITQHYSKWESITSDPTILDIVYNGLKLDFQIDIPSCKPYQYSRTARETEIINSEIQKLLTKEVIQETTVEADDFFSSVKRKIKLSE